MMDEIKEKPCNKNAPIHDFLTASALKLAEKQRCLEECPTGYHQESDIVSRTHTKTTKKVRVKYCVPVDDEGNKIPLQLSENADLNRKILRAGQDIVKFGDDNIIDKFPARVKEDILYLEDIPERDIKEGDLRYQRLKTSIDPEKVTSRKSLNEEAGKLLQHNNYVACSSAVKKMFKDKNFDDDRIFHSFAMMANIQRHDTLAKNVFNTCRDVAYREVHEKNLRQTKQDLEKVKTDAEKKSLQEKMDYYNEKITGTTCDLAIGKRGKIPVVKSAGELESCCTMVIDEQNRRKAEGLRSRPKSVDAIVKQCVVLEPKFQKMIGN